MRLCPYAKWLHNVSRHRMGEEKGKHHAGAIAKAVAPPFRLPRDLELAFEYVSVTKTEGAIEYSTRFCNWS